MRITRLSFLSLLLLGGMFFSPLGSSYSDNAYGQDQSGQNQDRGPGGAGPGGEGPGGRGRGPGRGGFGGRMMGGMASILGMPEVQQELKLDDAQKQSLMAIRDEMGGGRGGPGGPGGPGPGGPGGPGGRGGPGAGGPGAGGPPSDEQMKEMAERMKKMRAEMETKVADVLDPDQNTRLLGLLIQREGGRALSCKVLTSALELTPEQLTKLDEAEDASRKESQTAMREAMGGGGGGDWMKMRAQMEEMNKKAGDSMIAVLTSEQKAKFEEMKGEAFTFPEGGRGGFGGPGGPGGPGGRGNRPGGRGERPNIQ